MANPPLPPRKRLEYELGDKEYSIQEIVEQFEDLIPFSVVVSKGYTNKFLPNYGLEENKAYRVQCVSRKDRILACIDKGDGLPVYYSIPDTYYINMVQVDEYGKNISARQSLDQLLSKTALPFTARLVTDAFSRIEGRALFTSHIPPFRLVKLFQEIHLLLNNIPNIAKHSEIEEDIAYVPQYYDRIRFKRIKGIKGVPKAAFKAMERELDRNASGLEFDMQYGHVEIAEFRSHAHRSDLYYGSVEPMRYGMIPDLFPKYTPSLPTDVYEDLTKVKEEDVYFSIGQDRLGNKWTMTDSTSSKPRDYTNNIPRGAVKPRLVQSSQNPVNVHAQSQKSSASALKRSQSESIDVKSLPQVKSTEDIAKLNIDQVGGYLEKLKLDSYVPLFKEQLVDGVVLRDLNKDILMSDFGFKAVDAIKLTHFIKDGHLPK